MWKLFGLLVGGVEGCGFLGRGWLRWKFGWLVGWGELSGCGIELGCLCDCGVFWKRKL